MGFEASHPFFIHNFKLNLILNVEYLFIKQALILFKHYYIKSIRFLKF